MTTIAMTTDREVIEGALTLIEVDGGWTQGTYCRDAVGFEVQPAADSSGRMDPGAHRARRWRRLCGADAVRSRPVQLLPRRGAARSSGLLARRGIPTRHKRRSIAWSACCCTWPTPSTRRAGRACRPTTTIAHTTDADAVLMLKRAAAHLDAQEQS